MQLVLAGDVAPEILEKVHRVTHDATPQHGPGFPRALATVREGPSAVTYTPNIDYSRHVAPKFTMREVGSLSGGERQRVVLARALAQQADIVLLDEPTTALDLGHQQDVLDLVESLRRDRGLTVVATLHDLTLAARYGDRIAVLSGGRIVETGPPSAVLTAATIAEHFGATVRIIDDPDGPVIVPTTGEPQ